MSSGSPNGSRMIGWVAVTSKVCSPRPVRAIVNGEVHGCGSPPSTEHSKRTSGWSAEKTNVARGSSLSMSGPDSIVVTGATVCPIVHSYSTHCSSHVPPGPLASTKNDCGPWLRPVRVLGELHGSSSTPSFQQMNVEPGRSAAQVNVAAVLLEISGGPVRNVVTGGSSTSHS